MVMRRIKPGDLPARFTVYFDGCCEPKNPGGTAGYGVAIFAHDHTSKTGEIAHRHSGYIEASPTTSNNVAEYLAVRHALNYFLEAGYQNEPIHFFGDSMLVICQLWGDPRKDGRPKWKIHGVDIKKEQAPGRYAADAVAARDALKQFTRCQGFWIPRAENDIADDLSKAELRRLGVEFRIQPEEASCQPASAS